MIEPHPRGLTIDEVAKEFGYHRAKIERALKAEDSKKRLKADRTAKPYRITRNEVNAWIERNTK